MFELASGLTHVEARAEEVLDIYNSINSSTVSTPGKTPEPSQAYIISVYRDGLYHGFIYLYLTVSNEGLLYIWNEGGVPGDQLNGVYQAAFEFAESMGFMMDNMHYRDKSPADKVEVHRQIPGFFKDLTPFAGSAEEKSEELLIESLEGEDSDIQLEAVEDEEEEINLDALTDEAEEEVAEEGEVQEIMLGGETAEPEPALGEAASDEDLALDALEVSAEEPVPVDGSETMEVAEEEQLLDSLDAEASVAPEEIEISEESLALDNLMGEDTVEGSTVYEPVVEAVPAVEVEEVSLTPEEASVLGGLESPAPAEEPVEEEVTVGVAAPAEEAPLMPIEESAEAEAPAADEMTGEIEIAPASPGGPEPAPVRMDGTVTPEEEAVLARLLAMM